MAMVFVCKDCMTCIKMNQFTPNTANDIETDACMDLVPIPCPQFWIFQPGKVVVWICVDPQDLNKPIKRNHFNMPTLEDVLPALSNAKVFSLLDTKDGFLQIHLSEQNSFLTTFWGPTSRYSWL